MKIAEIVSAFEKNQPDAPGKIEKYMAEMELETEELSPDVHRLPIWDVLELLFYKFGPKRNWEPRPLVKQWLERQPGQETDKTVVLDTLIKKANQPQELREYDFYIPTPNIRKLTFKAFQQIRGQYPDYVPDVNPVIKDQFVNGTA